MILSRLDLMACVKELGRLESTPQTNFVEKAGGLRKQFNPPSPPTTKSLSVLISVVYSFLSISIAAFHCACLFIVITHTFPFCATFFKFYYLSDAVIAVRLKHYWFHNYRSVWWSVRDEESMWCCSFENHTGNWWTWQFKQCLQSQFSLYDGRLVHVCSL